MGELKLKILGYETEGIGHGRFGNFSMGPPPLQNFVRAGFSVCTPELSEIVILAPKVLIIFSLVLKLWIF